MAEKTVSKKMNTFGLKALSFIRGDETRSAASKIKASLFAILIGLIIGLIPIIISGGDALTAYVSLFTKPFSSFQIDYTLIYISVFILIGAGIGVSFKTGLFNIGAAGQMLLAGAVTTMIGIKVDMPKGIAIPVLIIIAVIVGAFTASIAGFLKAQFNVHEVVSTILLNWIIFYLVKYIFLMDAFKGGTTDASKMVLDNMKFDSGNKFEVYTIVIMTIVLVAMLAFVLKFTTFGFKLRMNGLNGDAAEYAGVNKKVMTISSMAISGAFIGLGGFIFYSTIQGQMPALGSNVPTIAFEAITVTLLAFSSPLGAIVAGIFYGTIYNGTSSAGLDGGVAKEVMDLVTGIIVFASALAPVLVKTHFYRSIKNSYLKYRNASYKKEKKLLSKEVKTEKTRFNKMIAETSKEVKANKVKKAKLQADWHNEISKIKLEFKKHNIDVIERDSQIREVNKKFKKAYIKAGFEDHKHLKLEKKSVISSMKKEFKIKAEAALVSYSLELQKAKSENKNKKDVRNKWVGGAIW